MTDDKFDPFGAVKLEPHAQKKLEELWKLKFEIYKNIYEGACEQYDKFGPEVSGEFINSARELMIVQQAKNLLEG